MLTQTRNVKGFYDEGRKQCIRCRIWYEAFEVLCTDCHRMLRTAPHSSTGRKRRDKVYPPVRY